MEFWAELQERMCSYLGIDTSNYTTSVALYNADDKSWSQQKKILPVKSGELGLRQSDAVFHHVQRLPVLLENLFEKREINISAVGVSSKPRDEDNSYMPCFTVGLSVAKSISLALGVPCYQFSHQRGHIAAVLFGADRLDLLEKKFIAFHVSGGTTEAVLVTPDSEKIIKTKIVSRSLDLKAGQLIDRVGVSLGLKFPAGAELEKLALSCNEEVSARPCLKDLNCCLSGAENICCKMMKENQDASKIARYAVNFIEKTVEATCEKILQKFGDMPVVFSGGVMSNTLIKNSMTKKFGGIFAQKDLSSDNAVGISILTSEVCKNGKF